MASRIEWHKVPPATLRAEATALLLALGLIAIGWLSVPTLLLATVAELLATVALSASLHPQRRHRQLVLDVLKMAALLAVFAAGILLAYGAAGGFVRGLWPAPREAVGVVALVALRSGLLLRDARSAPAPRLHWARTALLRGAALAVGSFITVFACILVGVLLAALLAPFWPERAADLAVGGVYLAIVGVLACILSTMRDDELAKIARRPYIDD